MNRIAALPEGERSSSGFYPTPDRLIDLMLTGIHWPYTSSILEPSAGKGNIADRIVSRWNAQHGRYSQKTMPDLDCIEIDPNLRAILKDKGLRVVHDDFLTYHTMKRYSLIVMNPPFDQGAKHILKAISLLADGGTLIALCNAETIRKQDAYNERYQLARLLKEGEAEITYHTGAFLHAERKTDVDVALIRYTKPQSELDHLILDTLKPGHRYVDMTEEQQQALTKADFMEAILDRYNYEVEVGIRLIREYCSVQAVLNSPIGQTSPGAGDAMELNLGGSRGISVNEFVRRTRKRYWSALFTSPNFMDQMTTNLRDVLYKRVNELADYEFTAFNIFEIMTQVNAQVNDGVEQAIMTLFDDWTRKWHYDENSKNRYLFDGWKTNDAFAVNKKVIIPLYAYSTWSGAFELDYTCRQKLGDIEKVFNYLDGGRTPEISLQDVLEQAKKEGRTEKIETKYFFLTFYKKGTCHLLFKDMNILARFNIFAAKNKHWLPPSFGKKKYKDMTAEEQKTVKSFMHGSASDYDKVVDHARYFLAPVTDSSQLRIGG